MDEGTEGMELENRRKFLCFLVPALGAAALFRPARAETEIPALDQSDKFASAMGFCLQSENVDQSRYPNHKSDQNCGRCLHYGRRDSESARCDFFNKMVPRGAWCSGYSRRP